MNSKVLPFKFHFEDFQLENRKKKTNWKYQTACRNMSNSFQRLPKQNFITYYFAYYFDFVII